MFLSLLFLAAVMFLVVPVVNIGLYGLPAVVSKQTLKQLYSLDSLEGLINFAFYKGGVSTDPENVAVGKEGWLFLAHSNSDPLGKISGRNLDTDEFIDSWASSMKSKQDWFSRQGIPMLTVIAPNKHSIYGDQLPDWIDIAPRTSTDRLVERAQQLALNILDLREPLIAQKSNEYNLYLKSDTHWNDRGSAIAYSEVMQALDSLAATPLNRIQNITFDEGFGAGGDLSAMLKFAPLLNGEFEPRYLSRFSGDDDRICITEIELDSLTERGECREYSNVATQINAQPVVARNANALNDKSVLWIRDSFGDSPSRLYQGTFSELREFHYVHLLGDKLFTYVNSQKPDIVLYQIVERELFNLLFVDSAFPN